MLFIPGNTGILASKSLRMTELLQCLHANVPDIMASGSIIYQKGFYPSRDRFASVSQAHSFHSNVLKTLNIYSLVNYGDLLMGQRLPDINPLETTHRSDG